jgi:alpha-galactosidase/6-phospho-beta-glucosidase family protein
VKVLSKKEKKAIEDAEFDALLAGVPLVAAPVEKTEEAVVGDANSKNKKKKEKKKAKAAEEAKTDAPVVEAKELTAEEKKAAIKAALEKRGKTATVTSNEDMSKIASDIKAEKEKRGTKKSKNHGLVLK